MESATSKAITLMTVALPTMFAVIGVFIFATKALHAAFPAPVEEDEDDDDEYEDDEDEK
ncbi:hypothetical protein [Sporomusa sphaeroides]|uniref:Uncharacterized protein n=1 Tax=Sporomusa sphaeroides DSM 2875 TaxID=1337886 RepID=A0ABM9W5L8_9FIRM|nr:hypothetical protein [Sporomusa sphaeroides]OLS57892.1 hypothetical protein SPSPH_14260 [Sporomusa sphaeroides DSM 2875]CVK20405.1 hypothetical protein SSPH_03073 [Sporomusa sphaeroides DSM 2875]